MTDWRFSQQRNAETTLISTLAHALHSDVCMHKSSKTKKHQHLAGNRTRSDRSKRLGMTLIEIMIVVVIMALISTAVGLAVVPMVQRARIEQTKTAVQTVKSGVTMYLALNNAECPTVDQLVASNMLDGDRATNDPWDHAFRIECDGSNILVASAGPDGEFETEDDITGRK